MRCRGSNTAGRSPGLPFGVAAPTSRTKLWAPSSPAEGVETTPAAGRIWWSLRCMGSFETSPEALDVHIPRSLMQALFTLIFTETPAPFFPLAVPPPAMTAAEADNVPAVRPSWRQTSGTGRPASCSKQKQAIVERRDSACISVFPAMNVPRYPHKLSSRRLDVLWGATSSQLRWSF